MVKVDGPEHDSAGVFPLSSVKLVFFSPPPLQIRLNSADIYDEVTAHIPFHSI